MPILNTFYIIYFFIYKRNPLSFNLDLLSHLLDSSLTLVILIPLIILFNAYILSFKYFRIPFDFFIVITYMLGILLFSAILVIPYHEVVDFNCVILGAFGSIGSTLVVL